MKTLFFIAAAAILSLNAIEDLPNKYANQYCVELRDGLLTITHEGAVVTSDVTLSNGTTIKMDGTVVMKDGSKVVLAEGDCVDKEGIIMNQNPPNKGKDIVEPHN